MQREPQAGKGPLGGLSKGGTKGDGDAACLQSLDSARSSVDSADESLIRANEYELIMNEMERRFVEGQKDADEDIISKLENEKSDLQRQLRETNAELMVEAASRAEQDSTVVDLGRQVAMLQEQLHNATGLLESAAGPDAVALMTAQNGRLQAENIAESLNKALAAAQAEAANLRAQIGLQSSRQVQELKQGIQVLSQRCEELSKEKEELIAENKRNLAKCKEDSESRFGEQLRNINHQWKLSQERAEKEHKELLTKLEAELESIKSEFDNSSLKEQIQGLLEDRQSLENVVAALRTQLQQNHLDKGQLDALASEKDKSQLQELVDLRKLVAQSSQEVAELRSNQAILREENAKLYEKIEIMEDAEEALRHVQARARALEAECGRLHAEKEEAEAEAELLYSRWRTTEQEALRFKRLYSRNSNLKDVIIEEEEEIAENVQYEVENEVDAAEKGVSRQKIRPEEVPTGQGALMGWVERCEAMAGRLRTAEANASRLATQMDHQEARVRVLTEEKIALLQKNKELSDKVVTLQRTSASVARSKLLMNQYELKIGQLENERGHLQKALAQLETELTKARGSRVDNRDLESAAKQAIILEHSLKHAKQAQNLLQVKVSNLEELVTSLEAGLNAVGSKLEESSAELAAAWATASGHQEAASSFSAQLAACQERAARLEQRMASALAADELTLSLENGLRDLVEELVTEVGDLKAALKAERLKSSKQPEVLQERINSAILLEKLGQQKEQLQLAKEENSCTSGDWIVRLEQQLCEMIEELECRKNSITDSTTRQEVEVDACGKLEAEVRDLQARLAQAQLQCQGLLKEKNALENELLTLEASLQQKELLMEEQRKLLQLQVSEKDLEVKKVHAEATVKEIELLLCRSRMSEGMDCVTDGCGRLQEVKTALDEIHETAVAQMREQLASHNPVNISQLQMIHLQQLEDMKKRIDAQEIHLRENFAQKISQEVEAVLKNLEGAFDEKCLNKVQNCVRKDVEAEMQKLNTSFERQVLSLQEKHNQEIEVFKAESQSKFACLKELDTKASNEKVENILKQDKERHNESLLKGLERSVCSQLDACFQEICEKWGEKCSKAALEGGQEVAAEVRAASLQLSNKYHQEMENLRKALKEANSKIQEQIKLEWEKSSEVTDLQQINDLLADLRSSGLTVSTLLDLKSALEEKHKQEMDELRSYFEQRCEKYTEDVISQRSQSRKISISSDEFQSGDFDQDKTKDCESFSEPPSLTSRPDVRLLEAVEAEWRDKFSRQEEKYEQQIKQLAKDMQDAHQLEISQLLDATDQSERLRSEMLPRIHTFNLTREPVIEESVDEIPVWSKQIEQEVERRVAEETQKISTQIDEEIAAIKKASIQEQLALEEKHKKTAIECIEQREKLIKELEEKFQASLVELQGKHEKQISNLKVKHEKELGELEEELNKTHKENLELVLNEMNAKFAENLEGLEKLLAQAHQKEVLKLQQSIEQQEESFVALLEDQAKRGAVSELEFERRLQQERLDTVSALSQHLQAMLAGEQEVTEWPAEMEQLRQYLVTDAQSQVDKLKKQHQREMEVLRQQLNEGGEAPLREQFLQQKQVLNRENELLRHLVSELVRYLGQLDEQLASFVDTHALGSDTESNASEEERRLRLAPDLSALSEALDLSQLDAAQMRADLDACLLRLRREVADIIGVSEASLVGTKQLDELKQLLAASEAKVANLEARLDGRARDTISEGFGDDGAPLGLEARLSRIEQLLEMVKAALQDEPHPSGPLLEQLVAEGQRLADETRREKDDLHMQIECADKQVRANRVFMDEQAAEREQERDEFARQLQQLKDALKDKDKDKHEIVRLAKEVEFLEGLGRENTVQLQKAQATAADAAAQFKAANDKVQVLREVVKTLEGQLEDKSKSEAELKLQLSDLQTAFNQESRVLSEQLDALKNDHSSIDLLDQIGTLEEQLNDYKRKLEEKVSQETPAQAEMNLQLKTIEMTLDKRTKELERVHKRTELSDIAEGVTSPESTDRVRSPLTSLRRLQDKLQNHTRAEDAAFAHIKKLEIELSSARRAEEGLQIERCELQKRVEDQLQQITSLQARLDQQRFQQSSLEQLQSSNVRQVQLRSAEQLENLKEKLAAKETEVKEVKSQLEKTKRVLSEQEALAVQREREFAEENQKLREMLEVTEEETARRATSSPGKFSSHLMNSLVAEKNAEIEELSLQVQVLRERLDSVHHTLETSDSNKEQLLETVHELRMANRETRSHSTMIRSGDQEVLRATAYEVESFDSTFIESVRPPSSFACSPLQKSFSRNEVIVESPPVQPEEEQPDQNVAALQQELNEKEAELAAKQEENEQLKKELTSISTRFEEYAQKIQNELSMCLQAEAASEASLDISIASENLQKILARVQDGGVEVLSLSELAVLSKHASGSVPETQSMATQTIRSSLTEATLLANLKRETAAAAQEAARREKILEEQIVSLKMALEESGRRVTELEESYATEKQIATDARLALLKHGPDSFQYQSRIQILNERVEFTERQLQQSKLDLDKERSRANALESALGSAETESLLTKADLEGETFRHNVTRRNFNTLQELINSKDKEFSHKKGQLEQEVNRLQSLLQQLDSSKEQSPKVKIEDNEEMLNFHGDNQAEVSQRFTRHHLRHLLAQLQEEREKNVQMHFKTLELQDMVSALKETEMRLLERHDRDKKDFDRHRAELEQRLSDARSSLIAEVAKLRQELAAVTTRDRQCDHEATFDAERRSWSAERGRLLTEAQLLSHRAQEAEAALTQEKANHILERMKAQYKAAKDTSSIVDHDKVEYLHEKCLHSESRCKSLKWQKRYLQLVITSFQATLDAVKARQPQALPQPALSPLSRFRAAALVVVSIHRMQFIVKTHLRLYRVSSTIVLKRIHDAIVDNPEPRLEPCAPAILPVSNKVQYETPKSRNLVSKH
ncbi:golgin subfamily A member 4-like isoform X3 [Cloeon dipterum]|uniref:golgin subfamily A member 4-like isoform X3 n=1 Tax=Cloeon dipterum TaxID=197152 RepID=UPI00321F6E6A